MAKKKPGQSKKKSAKVKKRKVSKKKAARPAPAKKKSTKKAAKKNALKKTKKSAKKAKKPGRKSVKKTSAVKASSPRRTRTPKPVQKTAKKKTVKKAARKAAVSKKAARKRKQTPTPPAQAVRVRVPLHRKKAAVTAQSSRAASRARASARAQRPTAPLPPTAVTKKALQESRKAAGARAPAASPVGAIPSVPSVPTTRPVPAEPTPASFVDRGQPIPDTYGTDRLVALPRDPEWIFGYWELTGGLIERVRGERGQGFLDACAWVLRLYRIQEDLALDTEIEPATGNWYIHVGGPGLYQLELGLFSPDGEWYSLLASDVIETPAASPSEEFDAAWRLSAEQEARLFKRLRGELARRGEGRAASAFLGASRMPASRRWAASFPGASWSGRPVSGSWVSSFPGASPGASGALANVGWIVGADGRQKPVMLRPSVLGGGPNWHEQKDLPRSSGPAKTDAPHFKVKLPRVVKGAPRPQPSWPKAGTVRGKRSSEKKRRRGKTRVKK